MTNRGMVKFADFGLGSYAGDLDSEKTKLLLHYGTCKRSILHRLKYKQLSQNSGYFFLLSKIMELLLIYGW